MGMREIENCKEMLRFKGLCNGWHASGRDGVGGGGSKEGREL